MGHTIWVDVRDRSKDEDDRQDCSIMLRLEKKLDQLCQKLNVPMFSDFYDYSALEETYGDLDDESENDADPPANQELKGAWFDSGQALAAVRAIRERLVENPSDLGFKPDSSQQHWPTDLLEELKHCQAMLERAASQGRQFRFLIVP
jgi:hypothetical protein